MIKTIHKLKINKEPSKLLFTYCGDQVLPRKGSMLTRDDCKAHKDWKSVTCTKCIGIKAGVNVLMKLKKIN